MYTEKLKKNFHSFFYEEKLKTTKMEQLKRSQILNTPMI